MYKRLLATGVFAAACASPLALPSAFAQTYPVKPIRVIIPFPPGEGPDIILRKASDDMVRRMGQSWVVENRPGGNMVIALDACARAAPDGYTMCLLNSSGMSVNPHVMQKLPYDPERDFKPISNMYFLVGGLFASSETPAASIGEFVPFARSNPGRINFGTLGPNSQVDVFRMWINDQWKTEMTGIHYKGGAQIIPAIVSNEIQFSWIGVFNALGQIKANKVKLLAVDSRKRSPFYPGVPTFQEVGLPESPFAAWHGLGMPAGSPDAAVRRVNTELGGLFAEKGFSEFLQERYVDPAVTPPEDFVAFMRRDRERLGEIVRRYNIPKQ
jgi:tripartite-type tricarboxylate transporter receptor subunit TctC